MSEIDDMLHEANFSRAWEPLAVKAVLEELASLRADRAKLDWLERTGALLSIADGNGHGPAGPHVCYGSGLDDESHSYGATYRDAIDAAMQKEALSLTKPAQLQQTKLN